MTLSISPDGENTPTLWAGDKALLTVNPTDPDLWRIAQAAATVGSVEGLEELAEIVEQAGGVEAVRAAWELAEADVRWDDASIRTLGAQGGGEDEYYAALEVNASALARFRDLRTTRAEGGS